MNSIDTTDLAWPPLGSKVAVALSGGVDSSLTARLLAERGYRVVGVTMKVYDPRTATAGGGGCYGPDEEESIALCEKLCADIGAPYQVIDLAEAYGRLILDYFRQEYRAGRTPNPCARCNPLIKFGLLPEALRSSGVDHDYFATGHYARLTSVGPPGGASVYLRPGADSRKDQSYFLYRLSGDRLKTVRFPLGGLTKTQVRDEARRRGLAAADKVDSQDFFADGGYESLFRDAPSSDGAFIDRAGTILGRHRGLERYTIGQRRGLGIASAAGAWYVVALDAAANQVVLGHDEDLFHSALATTDAVWAPGFGEAPFDAYVKIRSTARPARARVTPTGGAPALAQGALAQGALAQGALAQGASVVFETAQRAIAPGQSAVFYTAVDGALTPASEFGDMILAGGAIIDRPLDGISD